MYMINLICDPVHTNEIAWDNEHYGFFFINFPMILIFEMIVFSQYWIYQVYIFTFLTLNYIM